MIKLSVDIPSDVDPSSPDDVKRFLMQVKLFCEELASKVKPIQQEIRDSAPSLDDVDEGEDVRYSSGGTIRTYSKIDNVIRFHAET